MGTKTISKSDLSKYFGVLKDSKVLDEIGDYKKIRASAKKRI